MTPSSTPDMFTSANSNGADGGDWQEAACLSYVFWCFFVCAMCLEFTGMDALCRIYGTSLMVCRLHGIRCEVISTWRFGSTCINEYVDTDNSDDTGIINVHRYFRYICNCWEEMTSCADPHNGLRMRWIDIHFALCCMSETCLAELHGNRSKRGYGSINSRWYGEHVLRSCMSWYGDWNLGTTMLSWCGTLDLLRNGGITSGFLFVFRTLHDGAKNLVMKFVDRNFNLCFRNTLAASHLQVNLGVLVRLRFSPGCAWCFSTIGLPGF